MAKMEHAEAHPRGSLGRIRRPQALRIASPDQALGPLNTSTAAGPLANRPAMESPTALPDADHTGTPGETAQPENNAARHYFIYTPCTIPSATKAHINTDEINFNTGPTIYATNTKSRTNKS